MYWNIFQKFKFLKAYFNDNVTHCISLMFTYASTIYSGGRLKKQLIMIGVF